MFYLEHLIKKYGQVKKEEVKPRDSVVSVTYKSGMEPKSKPLQKTIDITTEKPVSWKKKLSENELSKVNSVIDKVSQDIGSPQLKGRVEEMMAGKAVANVLEGKAKAMHPLAAQGLKKNPQLRKTYLRSVGEEPRPGSLRAPAPRKPTTKEIMWDIPKTYWKGKLSEDRMSFLNSAMNKIAKKRYKCGSPKAGAASIEWVGDEKSKKAEFSVPEILEKIGADPNLVETARTLESLSEQMGRKTMLDFWQRLGRAALSAKLYASDPVRKEMMRERGITGAALGAPLGGLIGYSVRPTIGGALTGAAVGGVGGATLGSLLAHRKSIAAKKLLEDPLAQRALVEELASAIREKRPAQLV